MIMSMCMILYVLYSTRYWFYTLKALHVYFY